VFHRDIRQSSPLSPANRLCQIGRVHRSHRVRCSRPTAPDPVQVRHATPFRRTSACLAVFTLAALAGCGGGEPSTGASLGDDGTLTVTVDMKDMTYHPSVVDVEPGTRVVVVVENRDGMPHDLYFDDAQSTELLGRGESATIDLGVVEETVEGWCTVSGHKEAGMVFTLEVA
jgi:plastocyanin